MLHGYSSFIVYTKTGGIYSDIVKNVETRSNTSNYELDKPLPKRKTKNVIELIKDELDRKIMIELSVLRPKTNSCFTDENDKNKKVKDKRKCVIKNLGFKIIKII